MSSAIGNKSQYTCLSPIFTISQFVGVILLGFGLVNITIRNLSAIPAVMTATSFSSLGAIACFSFYLNYVKDERSAFTQVKSDILKCDKIKKEKDLLEMEEDYAPFSLKTEEVMTFFNTYKISMQFYCVFAQGNKELLALLHAHLRKKWEEYPKKEGEHTFTDERYNYSGFKPKDLSDIFHIEPDLVGYLFFKIPSERKVDWPKQNSTTKKVCQKKKEIFLREVQKNSLRGKYLFTKRDIETILENL